MATVSAKTFISKNPDSGLLHAYKYTGSHFKRRCGTGGRRSFILSGSGVTKVSTAWLIKQSDLCRKCKRTFDIESGKEGPSDSSTEASTLECPVTGCDYKEEVASVAAHVSGKKDEEHNWENLGYDGANDFKSRH